VTPAAIVGAEPAGVVLLPGLLVDDMKAVPAHLGLGLERLTALRATRDEDVGLRHAPEG
jgi:hypothetical protein